HVGNFVGVSLAYITNSVIKRNDGSIVVAIDPNIPHRAIENPLTYVTKLLCRCGLERNVMLITGFSIERNISSDGVLCEDYDPEKAFDNEFSCENVLPNMAHFFHKRFDVACLDGHHEASYLEREIAQITPLLRDGGWIILDDVDSNWAEIKSVFNSI